MFSPFKKIFPEDGWFKNNVAGMLVQQRKNLKGRHAAILFMARGTNIIKALEQVLKH